MAIFGPDQGLPRISPKLAGLPRYPFWEENTGKHGVFGQEGAPFWNRYKKTTQSLFFFYKEEKKTHKLPPAHMTKRISILGLFWPTDWGYRHIYIYAVELKTGPRFGVSSVKNRSKSSVKNWSKFFFHCLPIFIVFFGFFENANSVTLCQNSVFAKFWGCQKRGFRKENCIFCFCLFLCWRNRNRKKKRKWKRPKNL